MLFSVNILIFHYINKYRTVLVLNVEHDIIIFRLLIRILECVRTAFFRQDERRFIDIHSEAVSKCYK